MIFQCIGLGLVVSLMFTEILGLAAGGLVVPGYIAYYLDLTAPGPILGTTLAALVTLGVIRILSRFILLYGRRTLVFCVLAGYLFGHLTPSLLALGSRHGLGLDPTLVQSIGYIIPGLIAYWMLRQGILETFCTMIVAAFIVRLTLVVVHGGKIIGLATG